MSALRSTFTAIRAPFVSERALLDLEPEVIEHRPIGFGRLPGRGQVVADEDRVGGVKRERLQRAEIHLAAARDPDLLRRAGKAEQGEDLQTASGVELVPALERRPRDRVQEVDRD